MDPDQVKKLLTFLSTRLEPGALMTVEDMLSGDDAPSVATPLEAMDRNMARNQARRSPGIMALDSKTRERAVNALASGNRARREREDAGQQDYGYRFPDADRLKR